MKLDPVNNLNCSAKYLDLKYPPEPSKITKNWRMLNCQTVAFG